MVVAEKFQQRKKMRVGLNLIDENQIATIPSLTAQKERDGMCVKKSDYRNEEELLLRQQMYFERCVDFLALMIEKYGGEIELLLPEATNPQADRVIADAA